MHPVLATLGGWGISSYGVLVAAGYFTGFWWAKGQIKWMPGMTMEKYWVCVYGLLFGAVAGGRLLFALVSWRSHLEWDPRFQYFPHGYVFMGGLLGAIAMGFLIQRVIRVPYLPASDYAGVALPMGHAVGRFGCLAAGCCYGKPTTMPWGIKLGGMGSLTPPALWGIPLHPTQLYESAANAVICLFLLRSVLPEVQKKRIVPGTVFLGYIVLYSIARFAIEFFRGDDRGWSRGGLWVSQWLAIACALGAGALILRNGVWVKKR